MLFTLTFNNNDRELSDADLKVRTARQSCAVLMKERPASISVLPRCFS
jgi:hypothetical protein